MPVCSRDGCPELAPCPVHPKQRPRSPSSYVTGTRRWRERVKPRILKRDRYVCHYCGGPATTVDHLAPVARGGDHYDEANLVASCSPCNQAKGGR